MRYETTRRTKPNKKKPMDPEADKGQSLETWTLTMERISLDPHVRERIMAELPWDEISDNYLSFSTHGTNMATDFSERFSKLLGENREANQCEHYTFTIARKGNRTDK